MKIIKFDLPINGTKVKNLQELRDNLTDEILVLARSSQLERWLRTRQLPEQAQAVADAVQQKGSDDKGLFLALCKVLEVEAHPDDVNAIFDEPSVPGRFIPGARYAELYEQMKQELAETKKESEKTNALKIKFPISDAAEESMQRTLAEAAAIRRLMNFIGEKEAGKSNSLVSNAVGEILKFSTGEIAEGKINSVKKPTDSYIRKFIVE